MFGFGEKLPGAQCAPFVISTRDLTGSGLRASPDFAGFIETGNYNTLLMTQSGRIAGFALHMGHLSTYFPKLHDKATKTGIPVVSVHNGNIIITGPNDSVADAQSFLAKEIPAKELGRAFEEFDKIQAAKLAKDEPAQAPAQIEAADLAKVETVRSGSLPDPGTVTASGLSIVVSDHRTPKPGDPIPKR